ncbi:MAG: uncharacterized protein KVP18_004306 [Porospora cf. gigantea A]|uniref:uncharacterized protein n=1 Tax=Porospora cf. gigantea A TaxID=2853593 RepID=UPI00355A95C3|nr:MAG: hypothetical protein KVP18_004306 [Porospora cf. gigantea A]
MKYLCALSRRLPIHRLIPKAECCGIVAVVASESSPLDARRVLVDGIEVMQNRGYDSCGIATLEMAGLMVSKFASRFGRVDCVKTLADNLEKHSAHSKIGIGHTRWATHGGKTDENAHPHCDHKQRVALAHNGVIYNFAELRKEMEAKGVTFRSETDSEVIANLIGVCLDEGQAFVPAVHSCLERLEGTWGLAIIHKDYPNQIVAACHGSPMVFGVQKHPSKSEQVQIYAASEPSVLSLYVDSFTVLEDGETVVLAPDNVGELVKRRHLAVPHKDLRMTPEPFPTWTEREIYEQPETTRRALAGRLTGNEVKLGGLRNIMPFMKDLRELVFVGCGTSFHAATYGSLLMRYVNGADTVRTLDATEMTEDDLPRRDPNHSAVFFLSQSGETLDVMKAARIVKKGDAMVASIVNVVGSALARLTECGLYLNAGREVAVASTKAFTSQVTVLAMLACWMSQIKGTRGARCHEIIAALRNLPDNVQTTIQQTREVAELVACELETSRSIFVLGKGFGYPVALEGALKIKEISYVHSEGFAAGALKHGPFSLIDPQESTPVILLMLDDGNADLIANCTQQVMARGAKTVVITDCPERVPKGVDHIIPIPNAGPLTALLAGIPMQLIGYYLSQRKGLNPDKPRGLAKTVTVE